MRKGLRLYGLVLALLVLVAVVLTLGGAASAGSRFGFRPPAALKAPAGVDGRLAAVVRAGTSGLGVARALGLETEGSRVRVVVDAADVSSAKLAVGAAGGVVEGTYANLVEAFVPPSAIAGLGRAVGVRTVRAPALHQELAVNEAVALTHADAWQSAGVTGSGVKVAIIDEGFEGAAGALPGATVVNEDCADINAEQHGTAVAQIVHEIAPNAQLYLICVASEVGLGEAEQYVLAQGITIVNHSVGWFGTSRGDGTGAPGSPDAIVRDARAHGVLWVNAAGNSAAGDAWAGSLLDTNGDDVMEWSAGNPFNGVFIPAAATECGVLRWDAWPVTSQDYDLYLVDGAGNVVAGSATDQARTPGDPTEGLCYTNTTGVDQTFYWVVTRYSATVTPSRFDFFSIRESPGISALGLSTTSSNVMEPASSPAVLAVGATCWKTGALEPYSSRGPTVDFRNKPDVLAPDSVSGTSYGDSSGTCADGTGFAGTSAASPQVAGAAALLAAARPGLTPDQLETLVLDEFSTRLDNTLGGGELWLHGPVFDAPLAYTSTGSKTVLANADGTNATALFGNEQTSSIAISPDGTKIAFSSSVDGDNEIYEANIDGTGRQQLTTNTVSDIQPAWSSDGSRIAYDSGGGIWWVSADGSSLSPTQLIATGSDPSWHGTGTGGTIAYDAAGGISVMNADGTNAHQIAANGAFPVWSPDGTKIAFHENLTVHVMDAGGTNDHLVVGTLASPATFPSWSPDGMKLVYVSSDDNLAVVNADGTGAFTVTNTPFDQERVPLWAASAIVPVASTPSILGQQRVGQVLYAPQPAWVGASPKDTSYQWRRNGVDITGATTALYVPQIADIGTELRVAVTGTSTAGSRTIISGPTGPIAAAIPYIMSPPAISGTAQQGQTLTATTGTWANSPTSYAYQWRRCDPNGGGCGDIAGAAASSYTLTTDDVGSTIRVSVSATNTGGTGEEGSDFTGTVTTSGGSGGGGGGGDGGGGGGGGASVPNLRVRWTSVSNLTPAPNTGVDFTITVDNLGGAAALLSHLSFTLPATMKLIGAPYYERGSGCTGTTTVDCNLDYIPNASSTPVKFGAIVSGSGPQSITATASSDRESDPSDNSATVTLQVGSGAPPPPPPPPPPPKGRTLYGTSRADTLVGTPYNDVLNGGRGNDLLKGLRGNDILRGGPGNDTLIGGTGKDTYNGGTGNDTIRARDGIAETIDCGLGRDTAYIDKKDKITHCEAVHRS